MSDRQRGESLIELIVAMAILGTTMIAIIGGFLSLSKISGVQKDEGRTFSTLTAASEYAKARPCMHTSAGCPAETSVSQADLPRDSDISVSVSARSNVSLGSGTSLYKYVVQVATGIASYSGDVVVRP
jgi:type II secretory pathway pseudopilin PulG